MRPFTSHLWRYLLILFLFAVGAAHAGETVTYYSLDAEGSPVVATDATGKVIWRRQYQPYGVQSPPPAQGTMDPSYTGKLNEADTGLSYYGARWYDPALGRFVSMDPLGFRENDPQSFNPYEYGNDNPYRFVDPNGRASLAIDGGALLLGTAGVAIYYNHLSPAQKQRVDAAIADGVRRYRANNENAMRTLLGYLSENKNGGDNKASETSSPKKQSRYVSADTKRAADEAATDENGTVRCQYCGDELTDEYGHPNSKEYDHETPVSQGGDSSRDNINASCRTCNRQKGGRTLEQWGGQK